MLAGIGQLFWRDSEIAWWTVGPRGRRATVGLPGTGLFWTERVPPAPPPHGGRRLAFVVVVLLIVALSAWITL